VSIKSCVSVKCKGRYTLWLAKLFTASWSCGLGGLLLEHRVKNKRTNVHEIAPLW